MTSRPYFAFIDESGVLENDPNQPFFALGLLLIKDTSLLLRELETIRSQAIGELREKSRGFEFKFNKIRRSSKPFYKRMIDVALAHPILVCILILDKTHPDNAPEHHRINSTSAYINLAKLILKNSLKIDEECIVIADYLHKTNDQSGNFDMS